MTKSFETVQEAFRLHDEGLNVSQISGVLGVSRMAIRSWFVQPLDAFATRAAHAPHDADQCQLVRGAPPAEYVYLLGQYLGDGYIHPIGPRGVFKLRIATADAYPGIRQRCVESIQSVLPGKKVGFVQSIGCGEVIVHSKHLPCLFPQYGPGRKHERVIELTSWQRELVEAHPREFVAALIHSDGCRAINNVVVRGKRYSYPRYFFNNVSTDILMLCAWGFDLLGVEWRQNNWNCLSVAKRDSVAMLDTFIGPKS
ncbi:MAG TPA: helix-turn-helix domain-containing protein [Acidimicrobiales bacterium]|nr:helix-turn-helix domain-containing protein [Acidimicrobiales bacterium]